MFTEKGERRDFPIHKPKTLIGRNRECDLQIPLENVSRRHCELILKNGKVAVRDLGSSNGTYINKKRIQQAAIAAGELLIVGPVIFTVVIDGAPEDIKPVRTVLHPKKEKENEKSGSTVAQVSDDTGTVDLAEAKELKSTDSRDLSGTNLPTESTPRRADVPPKKETLKKESGAAVAHAKDDSGSIDIAEAAELKIDEDLDRSGTAMPTELEELSKQHKKKR
jgi:pSer/pThr/pTyr-binding forkhead associated (FHA) protein